MVKCVFRNCFKSNYPRSPLNGSGRELQWSLTSGTDQYVFPFTLFNPKFPSSISMKRFLFLQMTAEFQVPSPLVPTRENYFVRYCKHHPDGTWAVVDVSLDNLRPSPTTRNRRRPSGCLIQELPNGYSKVTTLALITVHLVPRR